MKAAFVRALVEAAETNDRIVLLTGDLGFHAIEPFVDRFPERFFNMGVAEQNMLGVAAGLADSGYIPYCYSIAPFASLRPYEFFRNGAVVHNLPVRVVAMGGGFEYGTLGISHYALEDIAVMRAQPRVTVVVPADHAQAYAAVAATIDHPGPMYFRLAKDDVSLLSELDGRFRLGSSDRIGEGNAVTFVATGPVAAEAISACDLLRSQGLECSVVVVSTLNPSPTQDLVTAVRDARLIVSVEEHYPAGGLGSLVCEVVAESALSIPVIRCAVSTMPADLSGSQRSMRGLYGLNADQLAARALSAFDRAPAVPR